MVMEYLVGSDLSQAIEQRGTMPVEEAIGYLLQACEAIAEAHAHGIVHRDLKPANLFLSRKAGGHFSIKVLDFGISKHTAPGSSSQQSLTRTSSMMGSPLYMSPEQMRSSRDVDARTDIWALAVILYELLAGQPPFVADTMPALCALILQEAPASLRGSRPDVPPGLEAVILRALEKDPARRYDNVADFAQALLPFAPKSGRASVERISRVLQEAGFRTSQLDMPPSLAPQGSPSTARTAVDFGSTQPETKRSPVRLVAGIGALAVALVGVGAFVIARDPPAGAPEPLESPHEAAAEPISVAKEPAPPPAATPADAKEPAVAATASVAASVRPPTAPTTPPAPVARATKASPAAKPTAVAKTAAAPPPPPAPAPEPKPAATGIKNRFGTRK
jgi:serine/threonine-protein kinase